jgi:hypothetical protein
MRPQIVETFGVGLLLAISFIQRRSAKELLDQIESGYFFQYKLKGGSTFIFMLSRYIIDVFHNLTLMLLTNAMVYAIGLSVPGTHLATALWVLFDPFFVYFFVFFFVEYTASKARLLTLFNAFQSVAFMTVILIPSSYSFVFQGDGYDDLSFFHLLNTPVCWYPGYSIVAMYQASMLKFRMELMLNQDNYSF